MIRLCSLILVLSTVAMAQNSPQLVTLDFEGLSEGTAIDTQYQSLGVTFSIDGSSDLPIIAAQGSPAVAFSGSGADSPMSSGTRGLTDPLVAGDASVGQDIVMTFSPPVTSVRFFLIDVDAGESYTVTASNGGSAVDSQSAVSGASGTGNGFSTEILLAAGQIDQVVIDAPAMAGYAIDFVTFAQPCLQPPCGVEIEVAQESAPGAGDFAANVLGSTVAQNYSGNSASFYGFGVPNGSSFNGPTLSLTSNRSHLTFADTSDGLSIVIVHDDVLDTGGGTAQMRLELSNDPDGASVTVEDCPTEPLSVSGGGTVFESDHFWLNCCTDGMMISGLNGTWEMIVQFTNVSGATGAAFSGLNDWVVTSADGSEIPLVLAEDRRVRFSLTPGPICQTNVGFGGPTGNLLLSVCGDELNDPSAMANLQLSGAVPLRGVVLFAGDAFVPTQVPGGGFAVTNPLIIINDVLMTDASGILSFNIPGVLAPATFYGQCAQWDAGIWEFSNGVEIDFGM